MILIQDTVLRGYARALLEAATVPAARADIVADSLVAANLRAVDSHGVQLLPHYVAQIRAGGIDPTTDGAVVSRSGACAVYDAQRGLGQPVAAQCCDLAIDMAREHGAGAVTVREGNHFGTCAYWADRMAEAGMLGMVMCNATPLVAPWQGKDRRFGTNPICVAVPGSPVWLLDMATTTVALNRIHKAALCGQAEIPAGWAMDADGRPTTDVATALSGLPTPLGGYKGYGLAIMVEIFCAVLSGGAMLTQVGGLRVFERPMRIGQFFLALDVSRFMPLDVFGARMRELGNILKNTRPAEGYDEVLLAGEPEWRAEEERRRDGIPVDDAVWEALARTAGELNVRIPEAARIE